MIKHSIGSTAIPLAIMLVFAAPCIATAQIPRTASPQAGGPPTSLPKVAPSGASPRMPFLGLWEGSMILKDGPGTGQRLVIMFDVADSVKREYSGFTILPGNARAPHHNTRVTSGSMLWEQPNSGGGSWYYIARLVSRDSIAVTVVLRDWPQGGGKSPNGSFVMTRLPESAGGSRRAPSGR